MSPAPLADRLRPQAAACVVGQAHLLGSDQPLERALRSGKVESMLLWGPPGVGKTTLARILGRAGGAECTALSPVLHRLHDFRAAIALALARSSAGHKVRLFIDEIHNCTAQQQIALLEAVKSAHLTVIGTTTENPSFTLKPALLSTMKVYVLAALDEPALLQVLEHAQQLSDVALDAAALAAVAALADGDARRGLNLLEQLWTAAHAAGVATVDAIFARATLATPGRRFDKRGEAFYDQISALHKSVRGSHPDAALYWLCRMLDGGVDPQYLIRRMLCMAWDDIGLADPRAVHIVLHAAATWERLGAPEGHLALGQAALYLAVADKSNAGAVAFGAAMAYVRSHPAQPVPSSVRGNRRGHS